MYKVSFYSVIVITCKYRLLIIKDCLSFGQRVVVGLLVVLVIEPSTRLKGMRQQIGAAGKENLLHIGTGDVHGKVTEFAEHLSTGTAWSGQSVLNLFRHYTQSQKLQLILRNGLDECASFSANGHAERGVFNVTAGTYTSVSATSSSTHLETTVRRVGEFAGFRGLADQLLDLCIWNIVIIDIRVSLIIQLLQVSIL